MKNILVVGCSSGIGHAITQKLMKEHRVYGTYYTHEVDFSSAQVSVHYLNVLEDKIELPFLPETLDGLVYCPGAIQLKPFARIKEEDFIRDYKLQVTGAAKVIQAALPHLKKANRASIVLFSTVAVQMGFTYHTLVSASKGALEGMTRALAAELATQINVNAIAPSITQTPLAAGILSTPERIEANAQRHALKRVGTAEDIASAACYLLSDESSWVTGQIFPIDGGMSSIK